MTTHTSRAIAATAALLFALPALAQQAPAADPHHPDSPAGGPPAVQPAPTPATPGGMGMMGMMSREGGGPGMAMMRHHAAPMNVIINVGPGITLEVEDADRAGGSARPGAMRGAMLGGMAGGSPMGMAGAPASAGPLHEMLAERVEGGLAFLRAELRIRPDQEVAWTGFAGKIRDAAARYRAAVAQMPRPGAGLEGRLAAAEARLAAELARAQACREAAAALLPVLDDAQRRTVDALAWLVIPGSGPGPMAGGMAR
ncbi:hypothetical protein GXW74_20655 [Roseomonas eburnea]|uniref:LTXXQ motif family protein n=1 Tax=Neoroseomonas eburnea TaxID=1346889 RepID=A0A9X9XGS9_9PROT|nr:Spy/CpxP family protein refolding chaperone [Neoroseomonas eburnea]MBR0682915.1 hypothetical protein [Neoroseomonas eburnea]